MGTLTLFLSAGAAVAAALWWTGKEKEKAVEGLSAPPPKTAGAPDGPEGTDGPSFMDAKETYFRACVEKEIMRRHPDAVRFTVDNFAKYWNVVRTLSVTSYLESGEVVHDFVNNTDCWGSYVLRPWEIPEEEEDEPEEDAAEAAVHEWVSMNIGTIEAKLEEARKSSFVNMYYPLPDEISADEEAAAMAVEEIAAQEGIQWAVSLKDFGGKKKLFFLDVLGTEEDDEEEAAWLREQEAA